MLIIIIFFMALPKSVKIALALASGLGDPLFNTSVSEVVSEMLRYVLLGLI